MASDNATRNPRLDPVPEGHVVSKSFVHWSEDECKWLAENYPSLGKVECAIHLGRSVSSVRWKASDMKLKYVLSGQHFEEWQRRAAASKVGRKRPDQALVIKRLHDEGKLKKTPEQRAATGLRQKEWIRIHGHPRGALGMKHSEETLQKISQASIRASRARTVEQKRQIAVKAATSRSQRAFSYKPHGRWKQSWREVGGRTYFFRSRWEANYARHLESLRQAGDILSWEHEPRRFVFSLSESGVVSYLPDFRVHFLDGSFEYHEVKGWMDDRSRESIAGMRTFYPDAILVIIDSKQYKKLASQVHQRHGDWEYDYKGKP